MGPHQSFQHLALFGRNHHRIGGQQRHGNLLSHLQIRHATTQPIRLLKSFYPERSQNFRLGVLGYIKLSRHRADERQVRVYLTEVRKLRHRGESVNWPAHKKGLRNPKAHAVYDYFWPLALSKTFDPQP
jgi:hypothetical protein